MFRVAVVIPAYNAEAFIERAVHSALDQRPAPEEVLVASDGSTDDTLPLAAAAGAKVLDLPKANANVARNAAARSSDADVLFFLDADDWFREGKIAAHLEAYEKGGHAMVLDPGTRIDLEGNTHGLSGPALSGPLSFRCFTSRRFWYGGSTFSVRRSAFESINGFRKELTSQQDLDFWIRLTHSAGQAFVLSESYTNYSMNPGSLSRNPKNVVANMRILLKGLPFLTPWDRRRFWCHVMFNTADQLPFPRSVPYLLRAADRLWDPRFAKAIARSFARRSAG
jgi:glycosyltransferase involved in cell wall biosynthesis